MLRNGRQGSEQGRRFNRRGYREVGNSEMWNAQSDRSKLRDLLILLLTKKSKEGGSIDQPEKVVIIWVRTMPLVSLARWLMSSGQLAPGEVPGNGTWSITEEQHSSLESYSSPCAAGVHEVQKFPLSAGAAAERGTFWLVDGLIYTDNFYQYLLLKGVLHVVERTLSFPFISWLSGDTCSCVAMAMKEEFRTKLSVMSLTSCSFHI